VEKKARTVSITSEAGWCCIFGRVLQMTQSTTSQCNRCLIAVEIDASGLIFGELRDKEKCGEAAMRRQLQCTVTHVLSNHRKLCIKVYQC